MLGHLKASDTKLYSGNRLTSTKCSMNGNDSMRLDKTLNRQLAAKIQGYFSRLLGSIGR